MSTELYLIGIVITGLISAIVGGLVGSHVTLNKATSIVTALRDDKPWEQAVESLYKSVPVNAQNIIVQGAALLHAADGLAQDVLNSAPPTPPSGDNKVG